MIMTEKMTYVQALNEAIAMYRNGGQVDKEDVIVVEKLEALRDSLVKKNMSRTNKPTKNQIANAELMNVIYDNMEDGKSYTVTDIHNSIDALKEFSGNKISALVRGLRLDGRVVRTEVKGRAYFTKV